MNEEQFKDPENKPDPAPVHRVVMRLDMAKLDGAVSAAFEKNREQVGDHWSWEWAIREGSAEDFVLDVLKRLEA